jgi:hypothetical protein
MLAMDINSLTISPDLFYSKNPTETWKPRCLSKITPNILTEISKNKPTKSSKNTDKKVVKRKVFKKFKGPQLGRIEKVRNSFVKRKLIKKTNVGGVLPQRYNNNNVVKPVTKKEEIKLQKEIKAQEEEIQKRRYVDENRVLKAKRRKGSGFKFFKSKNADGEQENESEDSDSELVPEIRDFTPTSSADTSRVEQTSNLVIDPEAFEDDLEPETDSSLIESLLHNLEKPEYKTPQKEQEAFSLDSLIGTLEGNEAEEEKKQPKVKFLGFGSNQLQIDAGQSKFGLVECKECGFSYNVSSKFLQVS